MRKIILILSFLCLSVVRASAQTAILPPILGDMNDDGKLSVVDITLLVNVNKGNIPTLFTNLEDFSYIVNNEKVIGTWYSTQDGSSITFNPDSTTDYHNAATYEFYPNKNRILVYDALGYIVHAIFLTEITDQYMDVIDYSTNVTTRYIKSTSWILVSRITLTPSTLNMSPGETSQLTATTIPSDAINTEVTWTSSNENVATVDTNGLVTAVAGGSCTITCAATDGSGVTATCEVTITQLVTSIMLSHSTLTLPVDGFQRLTATVLPDNAVNKTVTWSSSDEDVAEVTRTGGVSGVSEGTCTITCAATDGSGVTATCVVTVGQSATIMVTSITLNESTLSMNVGATSNLTATVLPSNATNTAVTWSSSNTSVAMVDANGLVTAVAAGTCSITCAATDGSGVVATCAVTVRLDNSGSIDGHDYIDLGLPSGTLWATTNVGASSPEDYGDYFAWGEAVPYGGEDMSNATNYATTNGYTKATYNWSTYKYCNGSRNSLTKYCTQSYYGNNNFSDMLIELELEDDAAYANWGSAWRMPTKEQLDELKQNCVWTLIQTGGIKGYNVTGVNGNSIFFPLAGSRNNSSNVSIGSISYYWSRALLTNGTASTYEANYLYLISNPSSGPNVSIKSSERCNGFSVRPVRNTLVESLHLSESALNMEVGTISQLTIAITPTNATNQSVVWTSSDENVATVDANGQVTAVAVGTCTITCAATDGSGVTATCAVTVNEAHEYVDLGLPSGTLWATCNIGASSPSYNGDYFAWGETTGYANGKTTFSWGTYKYCNGSGTTMTKYCTSSDYGTVDNKTELDLSDDAAYVNWGPNWRIPSISQLTELINDSYTTQTWTNYGYKITSKSNGNSIFLPAAGYRHSISVYFNREYGYYWSRNLINSSKASCLSISSVAPTTSSWTGNNDEFYYNWFRYVGRSIRPVRVSQ